MRCLLAPACEHFISMVMMMVMIVTAASTSVTMIVVMMVIMVVMIMFMAAALVVMIMMMIVFVMIVFMAATLVVVMLFLHHGFFKSLMVLHCLSDHCPAYIIPRSCYYCSILIVFSYHRNSLFNLIL